MLSLVSEQTKTCPKCEQDKYFSEFGKDKSKKSGLSSYCKNAPQVIDYKTTSHL